jgi:hypothetical protein
MHQLSKAGDIKISDIAHGILLTAYWFSQIAEKLENLGLVMPVK